MPVRERIFVVILMPDATLASADVYRDIPS